MLNIYPFSIDFVNLIASSIGIGIGIGISVGHCCMLPEITLEVHTHAADLIVCG